MNQQADGAAANNPVAELSAEFRILDLFASGRMMSVGPAEVEKELAINKGSASRHLKALAQAGYLEEQPDKPGRYLPGRGMWNISMGYLRTMAQNNAYLAELTQNHLNRVTEMFQAMGGIGTPQGGAN